MDQNDARCWLPMLTNPITRQDTDSSTVWEPLKKFLHLRELKHCEPISALNSQVKVVSKCPITHSIPLLHVKCETILKVIKDSCGLFDFHYCSSLKFTCFLQSLHFSYSARSKWTLIWYVHVVFSWLKKSLQVFLVKGEMHL